MNTLQFPSVPSALAEKYAVSASGLRPFGIDESDLAVDFTRQDTPDLVTRLLAQCAETLPTDFFLDLTVGKRLEFLLRLAAGIGRTSFFFSFKCGACAQELEFELSLEEIAEMQSEADASETVEVKFENKKYVFRKPCGRDQKDWQNSSFADESAAAQAMIRSLQKKSEREAVATRFPQITREIFALIDEAMDEADPLVNFSCRVRCAECGSANDFPIDLCEFALGELSRTQQFLLSAVHRLASRYHWSEKEIFAVPHWRRLKYLALIGNL